MEYNAPVLVEVGQAANLVLGILPVNGDNVGGGGFTAPLDLALGLDE